MARIYRSTILRTPDYIHLESNIDDLVSVEGSTEYQFDRERNKQKQEND